MLCRRSMSISLNSRLVNLGGEIKTARQSLIEDALSP